MFKIALTVLSVLHSVYNKYLIHTIVQSIICVYREFEPWEFVAMACTLIRELAIVISSDLLIVSPLLI